MPKTRQQKEQTVSKLSQKLSEAKSLVFADYRGLNMSQLAQIRKELRDLSAEFTITKNSLLELSFSHSQLPTPNSSLLQGPTATLFSYEDEISPIKVLVKALKAAQIGKVKGGFLGVEFLDEFKIQHLANLPSKQELRAKTVGVLAAPLLGMVSVLQGNLRNLVYALDQIRIQRGGDAKTSS